jgi:phenylacetate-CoA ligase
VAVVTEQSIKAAISTIYHSSIGWRKRFEEANISPDQMTCIDDLTKLPVLKKSDLPALQNKSLPFGNLTVEGQKVARIFMSPGPIYDPQGEGADPWRFTEALKAATFTENDIVQNTFSYHLSPAGFMFDGALRKIGATVIPAGVGNTELQIQAMKDCGVTGFVGTPSYLLTILEAAAAKGLHVGKDLKLNKAFFTAEKLTDAVREKFINMGIHVSQGYGTADVGCIAYETGSNHGLKVLPSIIVQICDPQTGAAIYDETPGEVVVTVLDEEYPLIRFGTGDLSAWVNGVSGGYIKGVLGRVSDGIKVKGMFIHQQQLEKILTKENGVTYYQAVVSEREHRDQFTIFVEGEQISPNLQKMLQNVIRINPNIEFVEKNSLDRSQKQFVDGREHYTTT